MIPWLLLIPVVCGIFPLSPFSSDEPHNGCKNNGLCKKPVIIACSASDCVCNEGTSGTACATVDIKCSPDPCSAFGPNYQCHEGTTNYTCDCAPGWTGPNCEFDLTSPCASSPCLNGGTCTIDNVTNSYSCECDDHIGDRCQYEDWCASSPCKNGGSCVPVWGGANFLCKCFSAYQGRYCQDTTMVWTNHAAEGCFGFDESMKSHYDIVTDNDMTVEMCKELAMDISKPYLMYTLAEKNCLLSNTTNLNATDSYGLGSNGCKKNCPGGGGEKCGRSWDRVLWFSFDSVELDPHECRISLSKYTTCAENAGQGYCVDTLTSDGGGYTCACKPPYQPPDCLTALDPCSPDPCDQGTCIPDSAANSFSCNCTTNNVGDLCQYELQCASDPCLYGGTCVENYDGTYSCECLQWYHGDNCESADICEYANPCFNGTCNPVLTTGVNVLYTCACADGFTGINCDIETNECSPMPCGFGSPCTDLYMAYRCDCITGVTGPNCDINIDDCLPWEDDAGKWHPNRCVGRDSGAVCIDLVDGFQCNCSAQWTEEFCDMNVIIKEVLTLVFGDDGDYETMIPLLEELMNNPAQIKDMVPFMIGQKTYEERKNLSWTAEDLFQWATFEEKTLDLEKDLTLWNDVVLGNCFTFNHRDVATVYKMRGSGKEGGFQTLMNVRTDEFQPWFDTAAIMVFVHNPDENIFSESVRYNAEPGGQTELHVSDSRFTRLDGKYGTCVIDPTEVAAYYYEGMYTTDGCLRSCYQDMIQESCGCMDPRYPFPEEYSSCQVTDMTCVEEATDREGDPSKWEECVCPLPCENQQYSVTWSRSSYLSQPPECSDANNWNPICLINNTDTVLITVVLPVLNYKTYAEEPAMDLNRFISNLGGLLGVLMGVGIIWFIEVVFLVFRVGHVVCSKE